MLAMVISEMNSWSRLCSAAVTAMEKSGMEQLPLFYSHEIPGAQMRLWKEDVLVPRLLAREDPACEVR